MHELLVEQTPFVIDRALLLLRRELSKPNLSAAFFRTLLT
jgi:hypothetical protein